MTEASLMTASRHVAVREAWLAQVEEEVLDPALPIVDPHHHLWDNPGERYLLPMHQYLSLMVSGAGNQSSSFPETWPGVICPRMKWQVRALSEEPVPA